MKPDLDPKELILLLQSEGWMTDAEWRKFGKRQAGVCVDEKVMRGIASRWDEKRLAAFPNNSKFEYTREELPSGREHYIITTSEWKLIMGHFTPSDPAENNSNEGQWSFCMWKLENGKEYAEWCKASDLRKD